MLRLLGVILQCQQEKKVFSKQKMDSIEKNTVCLALSLKDPFDRLYIVAFNIAPPMPPSTLNSRISVT